MDHQNQVRVENIYSLIHVLSVLTILLLGWCGGQVILPQEQVYYNQWSQSGYKLLILVELLHMLA